jgi:Uncharacterised protein (DUF2406)
VAGLPEVGGLGSGWLESALTVLLSVIADPDLSNPTRHRLERPLDTIRAFQAAIDGSYNNRRLSYAQTGNCGQPRGRPFLTCDLRCFQWWIQPAGELLWR